MSMSSTDNGLLTADNCAVIFIDYQPQMFFGVASSDRQDLLNNLLILAKAAKIFRVPVVITALESTSFSGNVAPQLLDIFPNHTPLERSSMNAWDSAAMLDAVRGTGRRNLIIAALWSEVCLVMPALHALNDGVCRLCGDRRVRRYQHDRARRRHSSHRTGGRSITDRTASIAGVPARLGTPGAL
jgi:nicotinamidase-related amidase